MTKPIRCRRCGLTTTAEAQLARCHVACEACGGHPQLGHGPMVVENHEAAHAHVYLIAGDGGWWVVALAEDDPMLAIDGRANGARFGAGQHELARRATRDRVEELLEALT